MCWQHFCIGGATPRFPHAIEQQVVVGLALRPKEIEPE